MGIGYVTNEVQSTRNRGRPYPNLPQALVDDGFIKSNAYSLWLNDLSANRGEILFGGVNIAKYYGSLQSLPIIPGRDGVYRELSINMTGLALNDTDGNVQEFGSSRHYPLPALLDTGSTLTYLPVALVEEIYEMYDVSYDSDFGGGFVPCELMNDQSQLIFTFTSPSIAVDLNEMVVDMGPYQFRDGTKACVFGIAPVDGHMPILGDTFLRSAYVVYDLENHEISLAQTNFNSTRDEILEIGTGSDAVPNRTGTASPTDQTHETDTDQPGPETRTSQAMAATMHAQLPVGVAMGLAGAGAVFAAM